MPPCSSLFLHPSDTDTFHLHPRVPTDTPLAVVSRHQTSAQTRTDTRHQRKQKGSGQLPFSAPTVLCCLIPAETQCPAQADRPWWGVLGKLPASWGFLHQGQKGAFQKGGAVLNTSWTSRLAWASVQPAAVLILKKVLDLQQLGAQSCDKAW